MKPFVARLPACVTLAACAALLAAGPIAQPARYHHFADVSSLFGLPHAADVLSSLGFAVVGLWGWLRLAPIRARPALHAGWPGYRLFLAGLMLTAAGSAWYHLAPDDFRLLWDRLPIAVASAGLLAAVRAETVGCRRPRGEAAGLALLAVASVAWWHATNDGGDGDLRPYLLMQGLPLLLVPLWQGIYGVAGSERWRFGAAIMLYVAAKLAEVFDHELLAATALVSGHTLKHLLAAAAAALVVAALARRREAPAAAVSGR